MKKAAIWFQVIFQIWLFTSTEKGYKHHRFAFKITKKKYLENIEGNRFYLEYSRVHVSLSGGPDWSVDRSSDCKGGTWKAFPCCECYEHVAGGWRRCWMNGHSIYIYEGKKERNKMKDFIWGLCWAEIRIIRYKIRTLELYKLCKWFQVKYRTFCWKIA